jgi:NAD(P)-dependent dehydrogenase (short-subunit alcohol dehydrogenase family)
MLPGPTQQFEGSLRQKEHHLAVHAIMRHASGGDGIPMQSQALSTWQGTALVVGTGGIGCALLEALAERTPNLLLLGASRHRPQGWESSSLAKTAFTVVDLTEPSTFGGLQTRLKELPALRLVINTAGVLHGPDLQPEKRLSQLTTANLVSSFALNAFGPILLAQALESCLPRDQAFHFASLSARVGSIGDNGLGGWYSYRASKAAQNQLLRTLAIEWKRRLPMGCVSLLHPGTTATGLSSPFQAGVAEGRLFSPARAANQLLDVLEGLSADQSGQFWAWDGSAIPW